MDFAEDIKIPDVVPTKPATPAAAKPAQKGGKNPAVWPKKKKNKGINKKRQTFWVKTKFGQGNSPAPGPSDDNKKQEESKESPAPTQSNVTPATTTPGLVKGFTIPKVDSTKQPKKITLKTKKILQQEMVRQRLNWIKNSNPTNPVNVPGTSDVPQEMVPNPTDPGTIAPQTAPVQPTSILGPVPSPVQIMGTPQVQQVPPPRSNAGSFFNIAVTQSQTTPKPSRPADIYAYKYNNYPKGIPKSFLIKPENAQQVNADSPIWPSQNYYQNMNPGQPTLAQQQAQGNVGEPTNTDTSPIFVQTENQPDVQQPYSPSDIYSETNANAESEEPESPEQNQGNQNQKRLSAFHRLGPVAQPKKPKLTINLTLNKEQPVREVVNETDDDPDRYTPVHLRQDIITSTDPTVVQYLPNWPWRKNVGIRKSATARSSRSAMILEQEQMEEAYEKSNHFIQITVKGYPSTWTKENVLDAILDSVKGYNLIPCFVEFEQHQCKFLTLRSRSALIVLHKTGFYIHKDGVELTITVSVPNLTLNQIDFIPRIVLRKRVAMGYADKKLDLKAFTLQNDISHFIYFPLNCLSNQIAFVQLQSVIEWEYLAELDLSDNRLTTISGLELHTMTPRLKHLNLANNYLEKINLLLSCRNLPLKTVRLEGNPLCHDYIDPEHYIKVIKLMFPAVEEIDGVKIHRRGELPEHKQNYCPNEASEIAEKFLETYFPLLDSSSENRSLIQGMYEDDATLTITYCYKLRYGPIYRCFRNLFLYARFLDEGETDSVVGAMAITKLINRWPQTEHDPFTFTVDVLYHTETTTILRISGILKLTAESLADDEHLLAFTRTVVLYSEEGDEYKIHNEMVYWEEPSAAAARAAFRVNTVRN
uniref:NTF2 domain-containing protein n=1 Tax=Heliothis virescens TaxID=7102 RepID=A0A2A4J5M5_HELVI